MAVAVPDTHQREPATWRWARLAAVGAVTGSGFLLARTIVLVSSGSLRTYTWWAAALLGIELVVDAVAVVASGTWLLLGRDEHATRALRAVAAMILMHAVRVLVFVLGRTGPWVDFDVRPRHRAAYATTWTWFDVWFAGAGAALSVIVLALVWYRWRRHGARREEHGASSEHLTRRGTGRA